MYELLQIIAFYSRLLRGCETRTLWNGLGEARCPVRAVLFCELVREQERISAKSVFEWSAEDASLTPHENRGYCSVYRNVGSGAGGHRYECLNRALAQDCGAMYYDIARNFLITSRRKVRIWFFLCLKKKNNVCMCLVIAPSLSFCI